MGGSLITRSIVVVIPVILRIRYFQKNIWKLLRYPRGYIVHGRDTHDGGVLVCKVCVGVAQRWQTVRVMIEWWRRL